MATELLKYIDGSASPYHAVAVTRRLLNAAGFEELLESSAWKLSPGGKYYTTRGGRTIVAWVMGNKPTHNNGMRILGAHTDSPVLKVRPNPDSRGRGMSLLTTEIYGSPLLHTWLDRDLKLAGALYCRNGDQLSVALVDDSEILLRANSLAPHLRKDKTFDGLVIDRHKDMSLVVSADDQLSFGDLLAVLSERVGVSPQEVVEFDLSLADASASSLTGLNSEFISAPRLDNLFSCYVGLRALIDTPARDTTSILCLYDSEEIGSQTWTGARSDPFTSTMERIHQSFQMTGDQAAQARAKSVFVSADMAHAEHYSFTDATDEMHVPVINKGLAIKNGARGNYAIGFPAAAWFRSVCRDAGLGLQSFMYRCDHGAGSSVGPMVTTSAGIAGIDVGSPMLAMHSIRELAGVKDIELCTQAFQAFYRSELAFSSEMYAHEGKPR
ncbi:MAG: M18 family aminopeptidase [Pseudomonadota bacterium]